MSKKDIKRIKEYDALLQSHIDNKDIVQLNRENDGDDLSLGGVLLSQTEDFLLMQEAEEFRFNGYVVLQKNDFESLRCDKFDKTYKKVLESENIFKKTYGLKKKISIDGWEKLFKSLAKNDLHVIVDCEYMEPRTFTIGPIAKVSKKSVKIMYYDANGILDKKATKIKYKNISLVKFGDRYSSIFRKYIK